VCLTMHCKRPDRDRSPSGLGCSSDFGEMAEGERFDDVRLDRRRLRVHRVGAEGGTDHGTRRGAALGQRHERGAEQGFAWH